MATNASTFTTMDDRALLNAAKHLVLEEHLATAALLRALMEIDTRRLYLGEGCASIFRSCTRVMHLSEGAAYNRIEAARAARSYPLILELFEQGAITLTAMRLLTPHLREENHLAVLASATHKSKREIEELVCALQPKPDAPASCGGFRRPSGLRPQALASAPNAPGATRVGANASAVECRQDASVPEPSAPLNRAARAGTVPNQLTVSRETHDRIGGPRRCFVTRCPRATPPRSSIARVTLLVDQLERQRFAQTEACTRDETRPGALAPHPGSRAARRVAA